MKGGCAVFAVSPATKFSYGKETYVLVFCAQCKTGPIIMRHDVWDRVTATGVVQALRCKQCSERPR